MTSNVVELKLSRVITPEKDELRYTNIAEIEKLTTTNGRKDENATPGKMCIRDRFYTLWYSW